MEWELIWKSGMTRPQKLSYLFGFMFSACLLRSVVCLGPHQPVLGENWFRGCYGLSSYSRRSNGHATLNGFSPPTTSYEHSVDRSHARRSINHACSFDIVACCRECAKDGSTFAALDPANGCSCTSSFASLEELPLEECSIQCTQKSPPLFSEILKNASLPTEPRPESAILPFGGDGHAYSMYHVKGPFIREFNLTAGPRYIVEGDVVLFEAIINLESTKSVGIGRHTSDIDVRTLTFDWTIANNVSQERVLATASGVASSIRSQYFPKRGTYSIAVVVSNSISKGVIPGNLTVRSPAPYDLQIRKLDSKLSQPSCFLYDDGLPPSAILERIFTGDEVYLQAEVSTGRNLTFEWHLIGPSSNGGGNSSRRYSAPPKDCDKLTCLISTRSYVFQESGRYSLTVTVSNHHGVVTKTIYLAVLEPKIWNPSFILHQSSPHASASASLVTDSYILASRETSTLVFTFQSSIGANLPIFFDFGDGTKFDFLGSSGSTDSSSTSSFPANYAYNNNNCRMTVLVGHIFRDEGTFLPSAIIESQIHRIHVTLDKRINVFQLLEGPIINVTKAVATNKKHRFSVQTMNKPSQNIRYEWRVISSDSSFSSSFAPSPSPYLDIVFPFPEVYTLWVNSSNPVSFVTASEEVSAEDSIEGLEASTNQSEYLSVGETLRVKAWVRNGTKVKFKWKFEPHSEWESTKLFSSHAFLTPGIYNIMVEAVNSVSSAVFELGDYIVESRIRRLDVPPVAPALIGRPFRFRFGCEGGTQVVFIVDFGEGQKPVQCHDVRDNVCTIEHTYHVSGEYVISAEAKNHVSGLSDKVSVVVEPAVPEITIEALGSVCTTSEPCLFVAKQKNGTVAPQGTFIYKWSNQLFPSRLDTSPVHAAVFALPGNHHLSMTAFNSASNVTASLIVPVISGSEEAIASPRLLHAPFSATRAIVNFTLKYLPANAKRIFFVTSRSPDSATRLSTVRGPAVTWTFRFLHPAVETLTVVVRDKDGSELIKIHSAITIEETIESLNVDGPSEVSWGTGHDSPLRWSLHPIAGSNVFFQGSLPEWDGVNGRTSESLKTQLHPNFQFDFPAPGRYNLFLRALNSVSRVEVTRNVQVMHPMRLLQTDVKFPLVNSYCSLTIIMQGQAPMSISVNWGDGGKNESIRLEEDDPRLSRYLRNGVDPKRHPEIPQIFGVDNIFQRVFKAVGHYTATVVATNPVSSHHRSVSFYVDEAIDGMSITLFSSPVLVIGPGANGVTAKVRVDVTSGSNLTFEWDFGDGASNAHRTRQEDGPNFSLAEHFYTKTSVYNIVVMVRNHIDGPKNASKKLTVAQKISGLTFTTSTNKDNPTNDLAKFDIMKGSSVPVNFVVLIERGSDVKLLFDFGDGSKKLVDAYDDWTLPLPKLVGRTQHVYRRVGTYAPRVTAFNVLGNETVTSKDVLVQVPPTGLQLEKAEYVAKPETETHFKATLLNGTDVVFSWDFGDGTKNESSVPTHKHRYGKKPNGEPYIVTVTANNRVGSLSTLARVYVQEPIQAVVLNSPSQNAQFLTNEEVEFSAEASPTDAVDYYSWDFGDGSQPKQTSQSKTTHRFTSSETVWVKVTAVNKLGPAASDLLSLRLLNAVERVSIDGAKTTFRGNLTKFELLFWRGTDVSCLWDFGDGTNQYFPSCKSNDVVTHRYRRGGKFDVYVGVNNTLSTSRASVVHFVIDYDCQPPAVGIDSPSIPAKTLAGCHLNLTPTVPVWLEPRVEVTCAKTETLLSRWNIWRLNGEEKELVPFESKFLPHQDYRTLYVPERVLGVGSYFLDLQVSMNGTILESNASCILEINPEPLELTIKGGSFKQVSTSEEISLEAYFNWQTRSDIGLNWTCYPLGGYGHSCFKNSSFVPLPVNKKSLTFAAADFDDKYGSAYVFNLTASSNSVNVSSDQVIVVRPENDLRLEVECPQCRSGRINANEQLALRALCGDGLCDVSAVELEWDLRLVKDGSQKDSHEFANGCMHADGSANFGQSADGASFQTLPAQDDATVYQPPSVSAEGSARSHQPPGSSHTRSSSASLRLEYPEVGRIRIRSKRRGKEKAFSSSLVPSESVLTRWRFGGGDQLSQFAVAQPSRGDARRSNFLEGEDGFREIRPAHEDAEREKGVGFQSGDLNGPRLTEGHGEGRKRRKRSAAVTHASSQHGAHSRPASGFREPGWGRIPRDKQQREQPPNQPQRPRLSRQPSESKSSSTVWTRRSQRGRQRFSPNRGRSGGDIGRSGGDVVLHDNGRGIFPGSPVDPPVFSGAEISEENKIQMDSSPASGGAAGGGGRWRGGNVREGASSEGGSGRRRSGGATSGMGLPFSLEEGSSAGSSGGDDDGVANEVHAGNPHPFAPVGSGVFDAADSADCPGGICEGPSGGRNPNAPGPTAAPEDDNKGDEAVPGQDVAHGSERKSHVIRVHSTSTLLVEGRNVSTPLNAPVLVVKPDVLKPGRTYNIKLKARLRGHSEWSEDNVIVRVNHGPSLGKCDIDPKEGVEALTRFKLICYEWRDKDDAHSPLTYQIAFRMTPQDRRPPSTAGAASSSNRGSNLIYSGLQQKSIFRLPAGLPTQDFGVFVDVAVVDSAGARTRVCPITIKVRPKVIEAKLVSDSLPAERPAERPADRPADRPEEAGKFPSSIIAETSSSSSSSSSSSPPTLSYEETKDSNVNKEIELTLKYEIFGCRTVSNLTLLIERLDYRLARIRIQYLAARLNRLPPLSPPSSWAGRPADIPNSAEDNDGGDDVNFRLRTSSEGDGPPVGSGGCESQGGLASCCLLNANSKSARLTLRRELRLFLLRRLSLFPMRHPTEMLQASSALSWLTRVGGEMTPASLRVAAAILNKTAERIVLDYKGEERPAMPRELDPFVDDLIDGVIDAASNILSALAKSSHFPSMEDLFVSVKLALTQLLKLSVGGAHVAGQAPVVTSAPFIGALGVKLASWATESGATNLSVGEMSLTLPPSFMQSFPASAIDGDGNRGRRSISDNGRNCLIAILINYRETPWHDDWRRRVNLPKKQTAQVDTVISSLQIFGCNTKDATAKPGYALPTGEELNLHIPINDRVKSQIPLPIKFHLDRSRMNVHAFNVTVANLDHALRVTVSLDPLPDNSSSSSSRSMQKRLFPLALLVGRGEPPTPTKFLKKVIFDRQSDKLDLFLDSFFNETGIHYVAVVDATFDAGRPRPNQIRQRRYRIEMWWSRCLEWRGRGGGNENGQGGEEESGWMKGSCKTLNSSSIYSAHCRCRHSSSTFAATSLPIPVSSFHLDVESFFSPSNYAVPIALSLLLFLFLVLSLFAWRADVTDDVKTQVIYLPDNDPEHVQAYQLTVETGFRRGAGTSSRVSIVLHGQDGMSETRELVAFHPSAGATNARVLVGGRDGCGVGAKSYQRMVLQSTRQLFARNSRDTFIITVPKSLGPIWKVQVWHDNSGRSPSWFLSRILVKDMSTQKCATFVVDKWFAVEEDDGKVEREILAADAPLPANVVFKTKVCQYLTDFHLWLSIMTRPSYSRFTRCQRCAVCLSLLLGYMALAAAWCYAMEEEFRGEFALLDVSWKTVTVGSLSSLLLFPINLLLVAIFRRSKVKRYHAVSSQPSSRKASVQGIHILQSSSFVTGSSDEVDGEEDEDRGSTSRMENRSMDVLVDDDGGGQLIAYSVFEQTLQTWQSLQEWAQRAWAKHYPNHVDDVIPSGGQEVAQVVKQVIGRQHTTIHSGMDATLHASAAYRQGDDVPANPFSIYGGPSFVSGDIPYLSRASATDPLWSAAKAHDRQYETDIAFSSLQLPAGFPTPHDPSDQKLPTASDYFTPLSASNPAGSHRRRNRERLFLPLYCRYVAWFLCVITSITAAFFTVSLGINFGPKKSSIWLQAVYFALVQSVFILHPIMVVFLSLVATCRHGNDLDGLDYHDDGFIECDLETDSDQQELLSSRKESSNYRGAIFYLYTSEEELSRGIAARQRSRYLRFARPPAERQLIRAREQTMKEKTVAAFIFRVVTFFLILILLIAMAFGRDNSAIFRLNQSSRSAFATTSTTPFSGVSSISGWWRWLNGDIFNAIYGVGGDGGVGSDGGVSLSGERGGIFGGNAYIIGDVIVRQSRVLPTFCRPGYVVMPGLRDASTLCHNAYASSSIPLLPSFLNGTNGDKARRNLHIGSKLNWTFTDWGRSPAQGFHDVYKDGSYLFQLPRSMTDARTQLKLLHQGSWIDAQTRSVSVFFTLFSPSSNVFTSVSLSTEFASFGGVATTASVSSTCLFRYASKWESLLLVVEFLFLFLFMVLTAVQIYTASLLGPQIYFRSWWRWIELLFLLLCASYHVCLVYRFFQTEFIIEKLRATHYDAYVDVSPVAFWDEILRSLLGLCLFLFLFQSVRLMRFLRVFGRTTRALSRATKEVAFLALLFFVLLAIFAQVGHLLFYSTAAFHSFGSSLGALGGALLGSYSLKEIGSTLSNLYYSAFLICFYGLIFSAALAVLLKHQRRVARRHRRRLQRRLQNGGGEGGSGGGCFGNVDEGGGGGGDYRPVGAGKSGTGDVWGNSLTVKEIGDLAWGKFLVWAGFRSGSDSGKTDDALSAEFLFAEFECQIDELLHKLDVISGSAPPAASPPLLAGYPPISLPASSATDTKVESSGTASKSGASSEGRQRPQHPSTIPRADNQFLGNREPDWTQLVDLGHFETGGLSNENDKDLRAALEYEIYRQLHLAPPVEDDSNFITRRPIERVAASTALRPAPAVADGGDQMGGGGEELLQLLGLDPSSVNSAAATELLLANFCSSMQIGNENDAFLDPQRREDEGFFSALVENDIPYHPPTFQSFEGDIEVDIPYHGPDTGDRDSLQSDELSIPDWTTPQPPPPPPPRSTNQKTKKSSKGHQHQRALHSPLEVEIPYHPPLEGFDEALVNVMVEVPSHVLDDDYEEDEEIVEMEIDLARVNKAYLVSPSSPPDRTKDHRPSEGSAHIDGSDSNKTKVKSRESEPESSRRRVEGRSAGRRLHKTRSRGKGKLLDVDAPASDIPSNREIDAALSAFTPLSTSANCDGAGGNRNLAFHASPNDPGRDSRDKETPC